MSQHVDGNFPRDAALFRQQHAFGKGQHLHCEAQIGSNLHGQRQPVVSDISHLRTDVQQQRLHLFKCFAAAADHD